MYQLKAVINSIGKAREISIVGKDMKAQKNAKILPYHWEFSLSFPKIWNSLFCKVN